MLREYLTFDEMKQLAATSCKIAVLKAASLFFMFYKFENK